MNNRYIVSYFGNLYMDTFRQHVQEMKGKGFNEILFAVTETDVLFNMTIFRRFLIYAKKEGMKCMATFWGYSAGEAIRKDLSFLNWLNEVCKIGFEDIFIDEPKGGMHLLTNFLQSLGKHTGNSIGIHICFSDDVFEELSDGLIKSLPVKSIGISNYFWTTDINKIKDRSFDRSYRLKSLRPDDNFVFLQGFDIEPGSEYIPLMVRLRSMEAGIKNFGFWSFRCTEATGSKRPLNYREIWNSINFK